MTENGWSINHLAPLVGCAVSTGNKLVRLGLVTPDERQEGPGRTGNRVGMLGMLELITCSQLLGYGFKIEEIEAATSWLKERLGEPRPLTKLCLIARGKGPGRDLEWHEGDTHLSVLRRPGQTILCIPTLDLYDELLRQLVAEEREAQEARSGILCQVSGVR